MSLTLTVQLGGTYETESSPGTGNISGDFADCTWLEAQFFTIGSNSEIGECRLIANKHPEDARGMVALGQAIQLKDPNDEDNIVWSGVVVKRHIVIGPDNETFEVVAWNVGDFLLHRIPLHGQVRRSYSLEQTYFDGGSLDGAQGIDVSTDLVTIDQPLIFNIDGEPNMSEVAYFNNTSGEEGGNTIYIFDTPFRSQYNYTGELHQSVPWTLKDAVTYLLNFYPLKWCFDTSSFDDIALGAAFDSNNPQISNVTCEGLSLAEALRTLCEPHNYWFYVTQADTTSGGSGGIPKHKIHFGYRGSGDPATVTLPVRVGHSSSEESSSSNPPNLIQADFSDDASAVINCITAFGSQKQVTTLLHTNPPTPSGDNPPVMTLQPGWDTTGDDLVFALEDDGTTVNVFDTTFRQNYVNPHISTPASGDGDPFWAAGRLWVVNCGQVPSEDLEDISTDLADEDDGKNSIDPRKIEGPKLYLRNSDGARIQQEDIQVEMSLDNGSNWAIVERDHYRVLEADAGMGIVFTDPYLERLGFKLPNGTYPSGINYWQGVYNTFYKGTPTPTIQIRILCSVKSDERVAAKHSNAGAAFPLAIGAIYNNENGYRRFNYNSLITGTVYYTTVQPEEPSVDDESDLASLTTQQAANTDRLMIQGNLKLLVTDDWISYTPGMVVSEIENRDITFDPAPTILRVAYHVVDNHVELILDNKRVVSIIRQRNLGQGNDQMTHRLGIQGLAPMQGAQQVPYVPGNAKSYQRHELDGG